MSINFRSEAVELSINRHSTIKYYSNMSNSINASDEVVFEYTGIGCVVPKDVTIVRFHPDGIEVEGRAFSYCNKLREVMFNEGLQKIEIYAFSCCRSLSSSTLPSTVTEIGEGAFWGCDTLREVILNDGLQKIGQYAFRFCTSLSTIVLPSTVTEIGSYAFRNCNILREVVFHGIPRKIGKDAFRNCTQLERFTFLTISTRLNTLIQTGHWDETNNRVDTARGVVERSGGDLFASTQTMDRGNNWNRVRESLDNIVRVISCYELKEATSIFELALWKFKLDQVDKANPIPRKKCRMDVPGPVKDIILQYLPYECLIPLSDV